MVCTEPGCAKGSEVIRQDIRVGGMGGEKTDPDVELERSPIFNGNRVGLVWYAHGRAELSTEYAHQGRLDQRGLLMTMMHPSAIPSAERDEIIGALRCLVFSPQSGLAQAETPRILLLRAQK